MLVEVDHKDSLDSEGGHRTHYAGRKGIDDIHLRDFYNKQVPAQFLECLIPFLLKEWKTLHPALNRYLRLLSHFAPSCFIFIWKSKEKNYPYSFLYLL